MTVIHLGHTYVLPTHRIGVLRSIGLYVYFVIAHKEP